MKVQQYSESLFLYIFCSAVCWFGKEKLKQFERAVAWKSLRTSELAVTHIAAGFECDSSSADSMPAIC